jgi:hypothetical protein
MDNKIQTHNSKQLAQISPDKLLKVYNPSNCLKHSGKLKTIQDVFKSDTPSLAKIGKENGHEFLSNFIKLWILYLNETLDLRRPLSESQIEMIAQMIISDYSNLKIVDITFIFKNAISGKYGEFYESLTIPKILSWFSDYFEERCSIAEMISAQEHVSFSNPLVVKWDNKVVEELFKDVSETISEKVPLPTLPEVLQSQDGYLKLLNESVKTLTIEQIKEIISKWKNYPNKKVYQEVLEKELKNRETIK